VGDERAAGTHQPGYWHDDHARGAGHSHHATILPRASGQAVVAVMNTEERSREDSAATKQPKPRLRLGELTRGCAPNPTRCAVSMCCTRVANAQSALGPPVECRRSPHSITCRAVCRGMIRCSHSPTDCPVRCPASSLRSVATAGRNLHTKSLGHLLRLRRQRESPAHADDITPPGLRIRLSIIALPCVLLTTKKKIGETVLDLMIYGVARLSGSCVAVHLLTALYIVGR
jgi:hypothetical protein